MGDSFVFVFIEFVSSPSCKWGQDKSQHKRWKTKQQTLTVKIPGFTMYKNQRWLKITDVHRQCPAGASDGKELGSPKKLLETAL